MTPNESDPSHLMLKNNINAASGVDFSPRLWLFCIYGWVSRVNERLFKASCCDISLCVLAPLLPFPSRIGWRKAGAGRGLQPGGERGRRLGEQTFSRSPGELEPARGEIHGENSAFWHQRGVWLKGKVMGLNTRTQNAARLCWLFSPRKLLNGAVMEIRL